MAAGRVLSSAFAALCAVLFCLGPAALPAAEVAGVQLSDRVVLEGGKGTLVLNGAGVRKKLFVKVYVGALYLAEKADEAGRIVGGPGPKRVIMHFLHKEVEAEKITGAWNDGFAANLTEGEMTAVADRLARFNGLFRTVRRGDVYQLDLVPGDGTEVRLNGELLGQVPGEDFSRAVLMVWLGEKPADSGLKEALLGR